MTKAKKEDMPWLHDDFDAEIKLYDKRADKYIDLNEEQTKHALQWIRRKQNKEMQEEMK
jgi:hypothetical protein